MNISTLPKYNTAGRLALLTIIGLLCSLFCDAQYGVLDSTFGSGGVVRSSVTGLSNFAWSATMQPDGKIQISGEIEGDTNHTITREYVISRYNTDGSLDATFGNGGTVITGLASFACIGLRPDGKIVLAGYGLGDIGWWFNPTVLQRYNSDGRPDSTFGVNGMTVIDNVAMSAQQVKVMTDGSILIAGTRGGSIALVRCDSAGALNASFGEYGVVYANSNTYYPYSMVMQCDGKIVTVGYTNGQNSFNLAVTRYDEDGSPDQSFGDGGIAGTVFSNGGGAVSTCTSIKSDGRIVVAGYGNITRSGTQRCIIAQYLSNGATDYHLATEELWC
jgi:uncharacterized delta-60 repeat protein